MEWFHMGKTAVMFVGFVLIAFSIVLFLAGIFVNLVPTTSPFYPSVQNLTAGTNSAIGTIANPLVLIPLVAVIAIIGFAVLNQANKGTGTGGGNRYRT